MVKLLSEEERDSDSEPNGEKKDPEVRFEKKINKVPKVANIIQLFLGAKNIVTAR